MQNLPIYVPILFSATTVVSTWLFLKATHYSKTVLLLLAFWIVLQSILGITGFYSEPSKMAARFPLLIVPPLLSIATTFITKRGRSFINNLDLPALTIFHTIRIPVEIVLHWLFIYSTIPEAMTFHGRNLDILSGLSAPLVYYFGFVKKKMSNTALIAWNVLCIALLLNVVTNALLALPTRFQQFGFEQPNIGVGYFPFVLLPACLVPLVLFSNLAGIRLLLRREPVNRMLTRNTKLEKYA